MADNVDSRPRALCELTIIEKRGESVGLLAFSEQLDFVHFGYEVESCFD